MRLWRGCSRHTRNGLSGRVDAASPTESPRQIPSRAGRSCEGHVVDPRCAPGLAAQQSRQGHPSSAPQPETLDRLVGIDPAFTDICVTLWRISHVLGGAAAKVLWTIAFCPVTLFMTPASRNIWR